ncbi:MAG: hypothetical protein ACI9S8_003100 [Chlamydiales bacterium]|jgi:hypothetical protein
MFEKNFEALRKAYPHIATKVEEADPEKVTLCQTRLGEINGKYLFDEKTCFLHSNYNAEKEAKKWFSGLEIEDTKVLIVYGIGMGHTYREIKPWLEENIERYLVFLEDDPAVIRCFLKSPFAAEILEDHQVMFGCYVNEEGSLDSICSVVAESFVHLHYKITSLPHYYINKRDSFDKLQLRLRHVYAMINYAAVEFLNYGAGYFGNFYHTLLFLGKSYWGYKLFNRFKGIPAVVCGAGPSLNKNFDVLSGLDERALIFAGGSGINALTNRGLQPHFGGSVDPNRLQYERMVKHSAFEMPTFYKSRVQYSAFHTLHGPRIYIPGSPSYPITSVLEKKLGLTQSSIQEGLNVLHFLIELASWMGCNPIIFAGIDLAYSNGKLYADGVVGKAEVTAEEMTKATDLNNNCFLRKDIYGNPVYTLWKWVAESEYSSTFKKRFPDTTFINATEGGLGMGEIPNMPLAEAADKYLFRQFDLRQRVHAELQDCRIVGVEEENTLDLYLPIKKDLQEVIQICTEMNELFDKLREVTESDNHSMMQFLSLKIENRKKKLIKNEAYLHILSPLNMMRSVLFRRKIDEIEYNSKIGSDKERILEMCEVNQNEMSTYIRGAEVNLDRMEGALKEYSKRGYGPLTKFFAQYKPQQKESV